MPTAHAHTWGPIQRGRFSGEPHRPCTGGCGTITLDLYLYCTDCGEQVADHDEHGVYRHVDPEINDHTPTVDSGEAPEDERLACCS